MRIGKRIRTGARIVLAMAIMGVGFATVPIPSASAAPVVGNNDELLAKKALAEEFATAARQAVSRANTDRAQVRQSAALLKAACMEYDREPRFPRLLAEAAHQLG